jgi:hypothetical protein
MERLFVVIENAIFVERVVKHTLVPRQLCPAISHELYAVCNRGVTDKRCTCAGIGDAADNNDRKRWGITGLIFGPGRKLDIWTLTSNIIGVKFPLSTEEYSL